MAEFREGSFTFKENVADYIGGGMYDYSRHDQQLQTLLVLLVGKLPYAPSI